MTARPAATGQLGAPDEAIDWRAAQNAARAEGNRAPIGVHQKDNA